MGKQNRKGCKELASLPLQITLAHVDESKTLNTLCDLKTINLKTALTLAIGNTAWSLCLGKVSRVEYKLQSLFQAGTPWFQEAGW